MTMALGDHSGGAGEKAAAPRLLDELQETVRRSRPGGVFYLLLWALCGCLAGLWDRSPSAYLGFCLAFLVLAVMRLTRRAQPAGASTDAVQARLNAAWGIVLLTALLWALASTWLLLSSPPKDGLNATAISSYAFAIASAHTFSMRLGRAFLVVALVSVPTMLALLVSRSSIGLAAIGVLCLVYAALVAKHGNAGYRRRMDLEDELRRQRDLYESQSRRDALTGLPNRRRFTAVLQAWVDDAQEQDRPLALMTLDLDHFKKINDEHGHGTGDECLRVFGQVLAQSFRGADMLPARLGGEEFAVLLKGCTLPDARGMAEGRNAVHVAGAVD